MDTLVTNNIVFDSQFIISQNYLAGNLINEMISQSSQYGIKIHITDIIYNEVLRNFSEDLTKAKNKNEKRQIEGLYILKNLEGYTPYFTLPDIDELRGLEEFRKKFDKWIGDSNIIIIPTRHLRIGKVFDNYFQSKYPFEMKKKHEFPDAFNIDSLEEYFGTKGQQCYLITKDRGVQNFISDVIVFSDNPVELLQLIVNKTSVTKSDEALYIEQQFHIYKKYIEQKITDSLQLMINGQLAGNFVFFGRYRDKLGDVRVTYLKITDHIIGKIEGGWFNLVCGFDFELEVDVVLINSFYWGLETSERPNNHSVRDEFTLSYKSRNDCSLLGTFDLIAGDIKYNFVQVAPITIGPDQWIIRT